MRRQWKRNAVVATVLLFVCAAVYLNWRYAGEAALDQILRGLFNREIDPAYPFLTYQDFLEACHLTEEDLELG